MLKCETYSVDASFVETQIGNDEKCILIRKLNKAIILTQTLCLHLLLWPNKGKEDKIATA